MLGLKRKITFDRKSVDMTSLTLLDWPGSVIGMSLTNWMLADFCMLVLLLLFWLLTMLESPVVELIGCIWRLSLDIIVHFTICLLVSEVGDTN